MTTRIRLFALPLVLAAACLCGSAFGQDAVPAPPAAVAEVAGGGVLDLASGVSAIQPVAPASMSPEVAAIAVVVPMLIAGLKRVAPNIPGGLLPYMATVLGMLIEFGLAKLGYTGGGGLLGGAIAGSAGVGLREKVAQLVGSTGYQAVTGTGKFREGAMLLVGLLALSPFLVGCAVGRTIIDREVTTQSVTTNGIVLTSTTKEGVRTTAKTLADAKFAQHAFRANQSKTTQNIGIGEQAAESTSDSITKLADGAKSLAGLFAAIQGIPVPQAAPQPAPAPRAAAQPAYQDLRPEFIYVTNFVAVPAAPVSASPRLSGTNAPAAK